MLYSIPIQFPQSGMAKYRFILNCYIQLSVTVFIVISFQTISLAHTLPQSSRVCAHLQIDLCQKLELYNRTVLPNSLGHANQQEAERGIYSYKDPLNIGCSPDLLSFLCVLHAPPCVTQTSDVTLPCREWCLRIEGECTETMEDLGFHWSEAFQCGLLPSRAEEQCVFPEDLEHTGRGQESKHTQSSETVLYSQPGSITEYDFAKDDVTDESPSFLRRRYDVIDLGDPLYFQGWADVQGLGAANDYCRIIGKKKRRFLSCALAGSSGQGHNFVSQRGVDLGHANTWFMRDLDGDGRDDYCRCVGEIPQTRISCLKAGELGFSGGPLQAGDQYTFDIPASDNCHDKPLNPYHGA